MSLGVEREGQRLTCCWSGMSRRPGRQTSTQTWGCPTSPSQSGNLLAASASGTSGWGSSYVSCTCAARGIMVNNNLSACKQNECNIFTMKHHVCFLYVAIF